MGSDSSSHYRLVSQPDLILYLFPHWGPGLQGYKVSDHGHGENDGDKLGSSAYSCHLGRHCHGTLCVPKPVVENTICYKCSQLLSKETWASEMSLANIVVFFFFFFRLCSWTPSFYSHLVYPDTLSKKNPCCNTQEGVLCSLTTPSICSGRGPAMGTYGIPG